MTTQLEDLLDAGEDLIGKIQDARENVERQLSEMGAAASEIDYALEELTSVANDLHRKIAGIRNATPHIHDPIAAATVQAIDNLVKLLTEAKDYFTAGNSLAAFGTLVMFDEHAEDLKAAFRLCQIAQRRPS